jgi:serine/tyrosine/threonine adenylyltransferase
VSRLLALLQDPFDDHPLAHEDDAGLPPDWATSIEISCSS